MAVLGPPDADLASLGMIQAPGMQARFTPGELMASETQLAQQPDTFRLPPPSTSGVVVGATTVPDS